MNPKAYLDKSVGGFYLSERTIPESVSNRGGIVQLYDAESMKDLYSTLLWLYRRLPRAYGAPTHINIVVQQLGEIVGENPQEFIDERSEQ